MFREWVPRDGRHRCCCLCGLGRPRRALRAILRHRFFLQLFRPGDQTLGSADVVEEFPWREGLKVCFSQATCKFSTWRLLSKDRSLAAPLDIFWGFACHELPEKEVDNTWTHRPHGSLDALPRIWRQRLWSIVHEGHVIRTYIRRQGLWPGSVCPSYWFHAGDDCVGRGRK